ncbi:MAG: PilZ domain [Deltaproteobacteria bacterium]|nr:PilZ domain [Deltaproteobacteria bacterium]
MQSREFPPLVEAYLVIDQPRQRLSHWTAALAPLDEPAAPPLASVAAHYDPATDQALIWLRYDELALGETRLAFAVALALLEEIGMIQPAELSEGDRKRFLGERLARCTHHVADQRGVVDALTELVRRLREHKASKPAMIAVRPPPIPAARGLPRGDTADPVMLVKAKGTRDDLPPPVKPRGTRDDLVAHEPMRTEPPRQARAVSPHVIVRTGPHRAATVEIEPNEARRMATASMRSPTTPPPLPPGATGSRRARSPSQLATEPFTSAATGPTPPGIIYARYLRSGRWVPIRIGALSLKGAALMSGALPRIDDHVDVALAFGAHRALVRGSVGKVSSAEEAAMTGTATFSVSFALDDVARRQLTSLLTAARDAHVTIKPPPPRAARRYPVEWSVGLGTSRGVVRGEALDVSRDGLFVKPLHALTLHSTVNFSSVLDDGEAPIAGRAQVIRHVTEAEARTCGLAPGYGLKIVDMGDADRERWLAFLARIEKRTDRRVLIGASPARLAELQSGLAALGYAVTGGTDPGALVQLASTEARPVDAALIDADWLGPQASSEWVQSLFAARKVPCVTLHGDAKRARLAIDKLLLPTR